MKALFSLLLVLAFAQPAFAEEKAAASTKPIICIDPGHPSEGSGGTVQNGLKEVHIAWVVGLKLQKILETNGYTIVMTKSAEDQVVANKERAMIANRAHAALCVRLHCDASPHSGFAVYYPDRQGTKDGFTGPSKEIMTTSKEAAEVMQNTMAKVLDKKLRNIGTRGDSQSFVGGKQGALTGSIFSEVPIVMVEMVVLSSKEDAAFIKEEEGQKLMAEAIARGVKEYVPVKKK